MVDLPEDLAVRVMRWGLSAPDMLPAARLVVVSPWLGHRGFVEQCIVFVDGERPSAVVNWEAVGAFLA